MSGDETTMLTPKVAKPKLKRVWSSANVLKSNDSKQDSDEHEITLSLNHNIYTFLLLLYSREDEGNHSLYSSINKAKLRKIKLLAVFSYIIQMTGVFYFLFNWNSWYLASVDELYIHDCDIPPEELEFADVLISFNHANDTIIDNQLCTFSKLKHTAYQEMSEENIAAKFIAVLILVAFIVSDFLSIPRLITLSKITESKLLKFAWILLTTSQGILIATVVTRIFVFIYNEDDVVNIFTVGISFIILTEIDDKLYDSVQGLNKFGDILFDVKIQKDNILKRNVLYNCMQVETHDFIMCITVISGACIVTFIYVCGAYIFRFSGMLEHFLTAIFAVIIIVLGVILPAIPNCFRCKCTEIQPSAK